MDKVLKAKIMREIRKFDTKEVYNYKEVDELIGRLYEMDENTDCIQIRGSLVDSYLINVEDFEEEFKYVLFVERYLSGWASGIVLYYIKDYIELGEFFPWIVEILEDDGEEG